jgi:putative ABC transport system substrate-binding protein
MRRREFITLIGGAAASWPLVARAQQSPLPVVGFLNPNTLDNYAFNAAAFREGLKETGYIEGQNVAIEYSWVGGDYGRLPRLAAELVRRHVNVIAATGDIASARAAQAATKTIPIVFIVGNDPEKFGLVASYNRPGGNVTGITLITSILGAKQFEVLSELLPNAELFALFMNPDNPNAQTDQKNLLDAARTAGRRTVVVEAKTPSEFDAAFAAAVQQKVRGVFIASDPMFLAERKKLLTLAERHSVPLISSFREFVVAGGLVSYSPSITNVYREAGVYVGRILRGAHPSDLPVVLPTKFDLVINLKTAKALGPIVPPALVARADEVIE